MIAAITGALLLVDQAPTTPPPTARWSVRADPTRCQLERRSVDPKAAFSIDTVPGSDSYRIVIAGKDVQGPASLTAASMIFAPVQRVLNGLASVAKLSDGTPFVRMDGLPQTVLDDLAAADTLAVTIKSKAVATIAVPSAGEASQMLQMCIASRLTQWGADSTQFAPGGRMPVASKERDDWVPNKDLLTLAGLSNQPDLNAVFRVGISVTGRIEDCRAITAQTEAGVEKVACAAVMDRPLFSPAKDPGGNPVRGIATFRVILTRRPS